MISDETSQFPEQLRCKYKNDLLFKNDVYIDQVERKRFIRALKKTGYPVNKIVADIGAYPGTGLLYFSYYSKNGSLNKNHYIAVGRSKNNKFPYNVINAGHTFHSADLELECDLGIAKADIVLLMEVLEHIRTPYSFLKSIYNQMRSGSIVYITTNNCFYSGYIIKLLLHINILDPIETETASYPGHCRYYSIKELSEICSKLGLNILSSGTFNHCPPIKYHKNKLRALFKTILSMTLSMIYPSHIEILLKKP